MELNKKNILRFSLASFIMASAVSIGVACFATDPGFGGRAAVVASVLGVLGVSSFMVGLVFPKE